MRIAYLSFGRAGMTGLQILKDWVGILKENIFVVTYKNPENKEYLQYLETNGFKYSCKHISSESNFRALSAFKPDYLISMHFRDLIPESILNLSDRGMNLHPSLLPKYSGCYATMWVIINGEKETGITYHLLEKRFDTGRVLIQEKISVLPEETGESLFNKAIDIGLSRFEEALKLLIADVPGTKQDGIRTYYPRKLPYGAVINPRWDEVKVERFIRAYTFSGKPSVKLMQEGCLTEISSMEEYLTIINGKNRECVGTG